MTFSYSFSPSKFLEGGQQTKSSQEVSHSLKTRVFLFPFTAPRSSRGICVDSSWTQLNTLILEQNHKMGSIVLRHRVPVGIYWNNCVCNNCHILACRALQIQLRFYKHANLIIVLHFRFHVEFHWLELLFYNKILSKANTKICGQLSKQPECYLSTQHIFFPCFF